MCKKMASFIIGVLLVSCTSMPVKQSETETNYISLYDGYIEKDYYIFYEEEISNYYLSIIDKLDTYKLINVKTTTSWNEIEDTIFTFRNNRTSIVKTITININNHDAYIGNHYSNFHVVPKARYKGELPNPKEYFIPISTSSIPSVVGFFDVETIRGFLAQRKVLQNKADNTLEVTKGAIVSRDGNFTIYIPTKTNTDELKNNKVLISEMENQVKNRPVAISFICERDLFDRFAGWMATMYELLPNPTISEAYYRDSTQDNDFVVVISPLPPGSLSIYVMTYEYFMATH